MRPWRDEFIEMVQTFTMPRDRYLALGEILEVLEVIMDTWDEDGHLDVRYWAGADSNSCFGRFYAIVSDPLATRYEVLQAAHELVRYLKSLLFLQTVVHHITNDALFTFMSLHPSNYAAHTLGHTPHPDWNARSPLAAPTRSSPHDPFAWEPKELYVSPLWPCLKLTVQHIRQRLRVDGDDLRTVFWRLDRDNDLCLVPSGLAARFQWHLAMACVGRHNHHPPMREQDVLDFLRDEIQPQLRANLVRAVTAARVNLGSCNYWPGPVASVSEIEIRPGLHDINHAGGPQTLEDLRLYCPQLLQAVQSMRDQSLWPENRSSLSLVFRERMRRLRERHLNE